MKRISASQMTVDTLYSPLSELVAITSVGGRSLEQWYYLTAGVYDPNRITTPLTLRPSVTCTDPDTGTVYSINMSAATTTVRWYYREHSQTSWTAITNTTESGSAPYTVKSNGDLVVRENKTVELRCEITYADPRTNNLISTSATETIVTNTDADSVYNVHITCDEGGTEYSPLTESSSLKTFHARATLGNSNVTNSVVFQWYTKSGGREVPFGSETDPITAYVSGQGTPTLVVDALYGEEIPIILRMKRTAQSASLEPCSAETVVTWRIPPLRGEVYSEQGSAVKNGDSGLREFKPMYNTSTGTIEDEKVREHMLIKWSRRNSAGAFQEVGWGPSIKQDVSQLKTNGQTSTLMQAEAYLKGPYAAVIQRINGVDYLVVMDGNNKQIIERKT